MKLNYQIFFFFIKDMDGCDDFGGAGLSICAPLMLDDYIITS